MGIKSELHEAILKRGGKVPPYGGIAAAMDELNKLPGGGGVSSWNDLTDKPFYSEEGEAAILPETAVEFSEGGEGGIADSVSLVVGEVYTVKWNGAEYICTATNFDMEGMQCVALGNIAVMSGGDSTGEPFVILVLPAEVAAEMGLGTYFVAVDGSTSAAVSITGQGEIVHGIEGKYLPKGTPYMEEFDDVIAENLTFNGSGLSHAQIGKVVAGRIYKVIFDGMPFECQAFASDVGVLLGNSTWTGANSPASNPAAPFAVLFVAPNYVEVLGYTAKLYHDGSVESNSVSVSIIGSAIPHKIDKRLMDVSEAIVVDFIDGIGQHASRSFNELWNLAHAGQAIFARYFTSAENPSPQMLFTLSGVNNSSLEFTMCRVVGNHVNFVSVDFSNDGTFKYSTLTLTGTT